MINWEDEKVTRASNRWRTSPDMKGWTLGETPSEPSMGQALYGTVNTENFIGLATKSPYKEVEFEIVDPSGGGDVTVTTPVPVPHDWLDACVAEFGGGDYETAANAKGKNGFTLWESYVAGLDPTDPTSQFKAIITVGADGKPVTDANRATMHFFKVGVELAK